MDVLLIILLILVILAVLYLLLLMTASPKRAAGMEHLLYAHRGYHDMSLGIPENSLSAFRRAAAFGYGVELDIQLTKDKRLVVFHDESLKRMCGVERNLREFTYEQLCRFSLAGTGERIPLFEEVLSVIGPDTPVLCEIKTYGSNNDMTVCQTALPLLKQHRAHLVVESFNPFVLFWFRRNAPAIVRGQLSCNFFKSKDGPNPVLGFFLQHMVFNLLTMPDFIAYRHTDHNCVSLRLMRLIYRPMTACWTVHSEKEQRIAAKNGFSATIFEGYQATPFVYTPPVPKPQPKRS